MDKIFATALAGLLLSSVGVAHADDTSSASQTSASHAATDKGGEKDKTSTGKGKPDTLSIGFESRGVATTTAADTLQDYGLETFSTLKPGVQSYTTDYNSGGAVTGAYTDLGIKYASSIDGGDYTKLTEQEIANNPDALGKSPSVFAYAAAQSTIDLKLKSKDGSGIDYLGFFMPVADETGQVTFYRDGVKVASVSGESLLKGFGQSADDSAQKSEDDSHAAGGKGVFINIFDKTGAFDEVRFSDTGSGQGFFTSDHTVGRFDDGVISTGAVPEPAGWTMMIVGVGLIGGALRRRRAGATAAATA